MFSRRKKKKNKKKNNLPGCKNKKVKVKRHASKHAIDWVNYNRKQFSRVFPKGSRIDSSNCKSKKKNVVIISKIEKKKKDNPITSWNLGCQMVALNYQTSSEMMWMNYGKFRDNGACGYILKPSFMLQNNTVWNPTLEDIPPVPTSTVKKVEIEIISARQLPKPGQTTKGNVIDPFVTVSIWGVPCDTRTFRTATVKDDGFAPNWKETFVAPLVCSELALIVFSVDDEEPLKTNHIGHYACPIEALRSGYRSIHLYDDNNVKIPMANLIVHITLHSASRTLSMSKET